MIDVLRFWLIVQLFALAALPLAWRLLGALPSRGYVLAKPLGLLLVTYLLWMGGSLGLLRNSVGGILLCWLLVLVVSLWVGRDGWRKSVSSSTQEAGRPLFAWLRMHWRLVVATEVLFLVALGFWAFVRSYSPEITTAGGEKFMELTFLNGILRSDRFPPLDPWLSGYAISYYYFGYIMLAALTQLSGLAPSVAFNVGLATWFALTVTAAFGVTFDMVAAWCVHRPCVDLWNRRGNGPTAALRWLAACWARCLWPSSATWKAFSSRCRAWGWDRWPSGAGWISRISIAWTARPIRCRSPTARKLPASCRSVLLVVARQPGHHRPGPAGECRRDYR